MAKTGVTYSTALGQGVMGCSRLFTLDVAADAGTSVSPTRSVAPSDPFPLKVLNSMQMNPLLSSQKPL